MNNIKIAVHSKNHLKTRRKLVIVMALVLIIGVVALAIILFTARKDKEIIIESREGVVTQIAEDCGDMEQLIDNKVYLIVNGTPCDGGSSFAIDDSIEISTSSGMVPNDGWSKDVKNISAGDKVRVTYKKYTTKNGVFYYNLNCEQCKVEVIQKRPAGIIVEEIDRDRYWEMQDNNLLPK